MIDDAPEAVKDNSWLKLARDCFQSSTDYLDANWRKGIERNIALFQSKHPVGSKYNSPAYKARSRLFRPKTKAVVRKNEAAAAAAFFSNVDVIDVEAMNDGDPAQLISADIMNEVLNYRLTESIPWFLTLLGAIQEAQVIGIVPSYQYWDYKEEVEVVSSVDEFGQEILVEQPKVVLDKPCVELIPIENFRFSPAAKWTDVVGSSPYIIRLVPMFIDDVRQLMQAVNTKTQQPKWAYYEDAQIRTAMVEYDTIRMQREREKQDPLVDTAKAIADYDIVWCHENFIRRDGKEMVYWTLGTELMLTEPALLKEVYHHGIRPFVLGLTVIEAHRPFPESLVGIGSELQKEANETVNQRRDNVSLVLNKRYVVKKNAQVDIESLTKNVPGGVTMANDTETDIREMTWPDVTSSAYREQDLLNVDFDELTGNFSQSSVQTNRQLNETVGGMKMLGNSASQMTEYLLRTFVETWVEPVLKQLMKLEQAYENDTVILAICGQRAEIAQKYGIDQVTDDMLNGSMTVRVNVGTGATDPQAKLGKFMAALKSYAEIMQMTPDAEPEAIRKELFGLLGYKDGSRFFKKADDPKTAMMQKQMQDMQAMLQEMQVKLTEATLKLQDKSEENQIKAFEAETHRVAALKPEPAQPVQDDTNKLELEFLNAERDRILKFEIEQLKAAVAERNKLMDLSASVIEAQLAKKPEQQGEEPIEPESVAQTLESLMQTIQELESQLAEAQAPKEIIRDEYGDATHIKKNGIPYRIIKDEQGKAVRLEDTPDYSLMPQVENDNEIEE